VVDAVAVRLGRLIRRILLPDRKRPRARAPRRVPEWSIGIYEGPSPTQLSPRAGAGTPVLTRGDVTDVEAAFVADPFMIEAGDGWHMFFEVYNRRTRKGEIAHAASADGVTWAYRGVVLAEPFHMSYPYVFEHGGDYYMIPESRKAHSVRLYRACEFPGRWVFVGTLLQGMSYADPTPFFHDGRWWLFTETGAHLKHDVLRLHYADDLLGPWVEHPASPVVADDPHIARPAGRVVLDGGRIIRYAQDCFPEYGARVRAFEVTTLTTERYAERELGADAVLDGSGEGWNAAGMHHVDPHRLPDGRWVACVDGHRWREEG
jgi:hypothetical protein